MTKQKMSAAVAAAAAAASANMQPNEDKLQRIRAKLKRAAELDVQLEHLAQQAAEAQAELTKLTTVELPGMFAEARIDSLGLEPEGNLPGYDAELKDFYSAKLPEDPELQNKAFKRFKWLSELARNTYTVQLGKGTAKQAKALAAFLKKQKIQYKNKVGVLPQTLTAEIRRRAEDGEPLAPADLTLLGAYAGTMIKFVRRKD